MNRLGVIVSADEEEDVVVLDKLVILLTLGDPGWDPGSGEERALAYTSETETETDEEGVWKEVTPERKVP